MGHVAWIVAIERYGVGSPVPAVGLDIPSAIGQRALELASGIAARAPDTRIVLSVSLPDTEAYAQARAALPASITVTQATQQALIAAVAQLQGEGTLLIYWVGHGIMSDNRRLLLCADSSDVDSLLALDVDSLLKHLRAPGFPRCQIGFFDACAQTYPAPTLTSFGGAGDQPTDQFFYFAASAAQVAPASTEVPGFSSTVVTALLDPAREFPPQPDALFTHLRSTFSRMNLSTRAFPLQWTEGSGDAWSRQGLAQDADMARFARAAHCSVGEFEYLWMSGRQCTSRDALSDALRNDRMPGFLQDLETQATKKYLVQLLADAWRDLLLARELEPACLRLGLSWQDWVLLYQQVVASDLLQGAAPPDRLIELLLMVLSQAETRRGRDSCIRLLTLAARRARRVRSGRADELVLLLKTHPLLGMRHDAAVAELPPAEGPVFLLVGLVHDKTEPAPRIERSWLYIAGDADPDPEWQPELGATTLVGQVNELINEVQIRHPERQLVIELLAPNDLLCSPREWLELTNVDLDVCTWLEAEHSFTLRWHDRMKGNTAFQPGNWVRQAALARQAMPGRAPCAWIGDAVTGRVVGIPFAGPTPAAPTRNRPAFFTAMLAGAPHMCWPREEPVDPARFKQVVADFMRLHDAPPADPSGFVTLADALREARKRQDPVLQELWLFIDDPARNPYDPKYTETRARGTT